MTLIVRDATERERKWITEQWVSDLGFAKPTHEKYVPHFSSDLVEGSRRHGYWKDGNDFWRTPSPRMLVRPSTYRLMCDLLVDELVQSSHSQVVCLASIPDEPLGWVVFQGPSYPDVSRTLHYIRVLGPARRHGIGSHLLRWIEYDESWVNSFMTPDGSSLLESLKRKVEVA
jgi:hypothetical protein